MMFIYLLKFKTMNNYRTKQWMNWAMFHNGKKHISINNTIDLIVAFSN